jgi:WD40 repeat protein
MTSFGLPAYVPDEQEDAVEEDTGLGDEKSWPVLSAQRDPEADAPPPEEPKREPTRPRIDLSKLKASLAKRQETAPATEPEKPLGFDKADLEFEMAGAEEFELPAVEKESEAPDFNFDTLDSPDVDAGLDAPVSEQTHAFFSFNNQPAEMVSDHTPLAFLVQPTAPAAQEEAFPRVRTETSRKPAIPRVEPVEPGLTPELGAESTKPGTKASDEPASKTPGIFDVSARELLADKPKPTAAGIIRRHKRTEVVKYVEHFRIRTPHQWVHAVAYNPALNWFASCGGDNTVCVWSVYGELLHKFRVDATGLNALCFSPDGTMLAAGGDEGVVHLWLLPQGDTSVRHAMLRGHSSWVTGLAFSSNAQLLFSSSYDGTVRIWDLDQGQCERILVGHDGPVSSVSAHLGRLTSSGHDGTLRLWNNQGIQVDLFDGFDKLLSCATNGVVNAWSAANGEVFMSEEGRPRPLLRHRGEARAVKVLDDGTVFSIGEDGFVMVYPRGNYEPQQSVRISSPIWSIDAYGKFLLLGADDGLMHVYSLQTQ